MKIENDERRYEWYLDWDRIMEISLAGSKLIMQFITIPVCVVMAFIALGSWDFKGIIYTPLILAANYILIRYFEWLNKKVGEKK